MKKILVGLCLVSILFMIGCGTVNWSKGTKPVTQAPRAQTEVRK
jgi:hypothetical protein